VDIMPLAISHPLRFLFALPTALLMAVLATIPIHLVVLWLGSCQSGVAIQDEFGCNRSLWSLIDSETLERLAYGAVTPAVFIWGATRIVPAKSKWVPVVFAALWLTSVGIGFAAAFAGWIDFNIDTSVKGWIYHIILIGLHIASSVLMAKALWGERLREEQFAAIAA
jgi:hypothetical protein